MGVVIIMTLAMAWCVPVAAAEKDKNQPSVVAPRYLGADWQGPDHDSHIVDGKIVGPWCLDQGGRLLDRRPRPARQGGWGGL